MQKPNFFMIGFPKCGTTAMSSYLMTHPQIYFTSLKEPFYWNSDFPLVQQLYGITTFEKYMNLFRDAGPQHRIVGEGTASYLFSSAAIPQILEFNPTAKFLVMLRNPVQWVQSWHNELVFGFQEDEKDFERAWNLQAARAEGRHLPANPLVNRFLQYRELGSFASFLEPAMRMIPPDQLKIIVLEEFGADARREYVDLCNYLGVDDDGRTDFPPVRESQVPVWPAFSHFLRHPPNWFRPTASMIRRLGWTSGPVGKIKSLLRRKQRRAAITPEFENELRDTFSPEIQKLEDLLGRSLDVWRSSVSPGVRA